MEIVFHYRNWFGSVGFYGMSTIVGYLMPSPGHTDDNVI